jgi:RNA polymerase sigma-70 factor (ECF subfamily)
MSPLSPARISPLLEEADDSTRRIQRESVMGAGAVDAVASERAGLAERFEREAMPFLDRLYAAAVQVTRRRADAEELVQHTYRRAFEAFGSFTATTDLRVWLFQILAEAALGAPAEPPPAPCPASAPDRPRRPAFPASHSAHVQALDRLVDREVKTGLRQLPLQYAMVIHLADVEDLTYAQIAVILGVPPATAARRLHHARRHLLRVLTDAAHRRGLLR